jgi:hypothetical protein
MLLKALSDREGTEQGRRKSEEKLSQKACAVHVMNVRL